MEPVVILKKVVSPRETGVKVVKIKPFSFRGHQRSIRKKNTGRRMLFGYTKTKHAKHYVPQVFYEPALSEHFAGFTTTAYNTPSDFFRGFSDAEISFSMTQKTLHPLYGFDDEIHKCIKTVHSVGRKYPYEHTMTVHPINNKNRRLRVLSLFEGVGSGLLVLKHKLNLDIETYYSSETSEDALKVLHNKFAGDIVHLGSVDKIEGPLLHSLGRIDLLIGGPPCSEVSLVNAKRKGLYGIFVTENKILTDPTSESCLYKEYIRIRDYLRQSAYTHGHLFLWLMEMTHHMQKSDWEIMTRDIGQKPLVSDASEFLPANRKRLFWTNVPQTQTSHENETCPVEIDDLLCPGRKANFSRCKTITSNPSNQRKGGVDPVMGTKGLENFYILELERLQGMPDNHTAVANLSISKRRKLIGKAWCVPQVASILRCLREIYAISDR